jgi:hypothetical protein
MPTGFPQQAPLNNFGFTRSVPEPQHGQKADKDTIKRKEPRSFEPRPGH